MMLFQNPASNSIGFILPKTKEDEIHGRGSSKYLASEMLGLSYYIPLV